jgi:hypothetical protein
MPFITQGKTNWKFLLIVIILAIIVGGGTLWLLVKKELPYQPSEIKKIDETANWKTYRNEEYGFEVKYPNNWYAEPEDLAGLSAKLSIIFGNYLIKESYGREDYTFVNFVVEDATINEYLNEMKKYGAKIEETNIASSKAYKTITTGEEVYLGDNLNPSISITIMHNNHVYGLLILYPNEISEKVFNQIVSTFKFLE